MYYQFKEKEKEMRLYETQFLIVITIDEEATF